MDEKKVREAIEELKDDINVYESMIRDNKSVTSLCARLKAKIENLTIAIEALEKQLPMKPVDRSLVKDNGDVSGFIGRCPSCNEIIDDTTTVCDCGQKLDWSE